MAKPAPPLPTELILLPFAIARLGQAPLRRLHQQLGATCIAELREPELRQAGLSAVQTRSVLDLAAAPAKIEELHRDAQRALAGPARVLDLTQQSLPGLSALKDEPAFLAASPGFETDLLQRAGVAVVGTRHPSAEGRAFTLRLCRELARHGLLVISGGARGIDCAAHQGALEAGAPTLAVLGASFDQERPRHPEMFDRLWQDGAMITEQLVSRPVQPWMFPRRNRLVAALAQLVVVVEGSAHSGALITAKLAEKLGRRVLAVPGAVDHPLAAAPNSLLATTEARACRHAADVLRALELPVPAGTNDTDTANQTQQLELPGGDQGRAHQALVEAGGSSHVDDIAVRSGLDAQALATALLQLELEGHCRREAGAIYRLVRVPARIRRGASKG